MNRIRGRFFLATFVLVLMISLAEVLNSPAQVASYSTSTSYAYTTQQYATMVTVTQTNLTGALFEIKLISAGAAGRNKFYYQLTMKNLMGERLTNVQLGIYFKFVNGTWTKAYIATTADFDPGEFRSMTVTADTDFNMYDPNIQYWAVGFIRASTARQVTTTRTLIQLSTFTFTSQQTSALPGSQALPTNVIVAVVAVVAVTAIIVVMLRGRGAKKTPSS